MESNIGLGHMLFEQHVSLPSLTFISWSFVTNANSKRSRFRKSSKESELRVQSGLFKRGGDITNLDYIVQRCALFVLAKHVETVTARIIETQ